ncbi:hypothetical protein Tco_0196493 [Tanacetum coccineum]
MSFADRKKEFSKSIQVDDSFTCGLAAGLLSALTFPPRADLSFKEESCRLKSILDQYCKASGQVISYEKSEISFSANVEQPVRSRILESLLVREFAHQTKYLGLPSIIGRSKKVVFQSILDRIKRKLGGWKEKTLLIAEK